MTLIGGFIILLAAIGLFFLLWAAVASVLLPWADKMQSRRGTTTSPIFIDDVLRERNSDGDPR